MTLRFLFAAVLTIACPLLLAGEAGTDKASAPEPEALAPETSGIQVRNNSAFAIYVIQATHKVEVAPKSTLVIKTSTPPISITPVIAPQASSAPSFKYVTLTGRVGPCEFASCLIVQ